MFFNSERHKTTHPQWDAYVRNFSSDSLRQPRWPSDYGEDMTVRSQGRWYKITAEGSVLPLVPIY